MWTGVVMKRAMVQYRDEKRFSEETHYLCWLLQPGPVREVGTFMEQSRDGHSVTVYPLGQRVSNAELNILSKWEANSCSLWRLSTLITTGLFFLEDARAYDSAEYGPSPMFWRQCSWTTVRQRCPARIGLLQILSWRCEFRFSVLRSSHYSRNFSNSATWVSLGLLGWQHCWAW